MSIINDVLPPCMKTAEKALKYIQGIPVEEYTRSVGLFALNLIKETYRSLLECRYEHFDALVGETSCQLRAAFVAEYGPEYLAGQKRAELLSTIEKIDQAIPKLLAAENDSLRGSVVSDIIMKFTDKLVEVKDREKTLILAHLLTTTRGRENRMITDVANLRMYGGMSLSEEGLTEITFQAKRQLADRSIKYMGNSKSIMFKIMSRGAQVRNAKAIKCAPCFYVSEVLLEKIRLKELPVVLIVKRGDGTEISRLAMRCINNQLLPIRDLDQTLSRLPAVIIEGESQVGLSPEELIGGNGSLSMEKLEELLLACSAVHPQYASDHKDKPILLFTKKKGIGEFIECRKDIGEGELDSRLRCESKKNLVEPARMCLSSREQGVDVVRMLAEVILSKRKIDRMTEIAEERRFGCDKTNKVKEGGSFAVKHIYCLSVEEAMRGGNHVIE